MPGLRAVFRDPTARIFERSKVLPRLFLPDSTTTVGALASNPNFAARALVRPSPGRPEAWTAVRPGESAIEIQGIEPARVTAQCLLAEERLLASSVYQDGGWTVLLDGKRHRAVTANGLFVGAWLPAGEHRIDLIYRAPGFVLGLAMAAVALAGLILWLAPPYSSQTATSPSAFRRMSGTSASGAG